MFGYVESYKNVLTEDLCVLDGLEEVRALLAKQKLRKSLVISELENITLIEEIRGKSQELFGSKRVINAQSSSIGWPTRIGVTPLKLCF
jgi:hypothetical protein